MGNQNKQARLLKPYQVITDRIVTMLEEGEVPWHRPWVGGAAPRNLHSKRVYRGINVFLLSCIAAMMGYTSNWWVTYKQAGHLGGQVAKGEKATPVVFWKILEVKTGADEELQKIPMLRHYRVFNIDQCKDLAAPELEEFEPLAFEPIVACETIVGDMPHPPAITHGGSRAFYRPADDLVNMPDRSKFENEEGYYGTLFHELVHSTGNEKRLNRKTVQDCATFGSPTYAKEELIAELGAAFLCGHAQINQVTEQNSAAYIAGWLKALRGDPKLAVVAGAAAQKAADWILGDERGS